MKRWQTCVATMVVSGSVVMAQPPSVASAAELFNQAKRVEAAALHGAITSRGTRNGAAWPNPMKFARWQDDAELQPLVEKVSPCGSPEYRQFDFWVGDWDVREPNGPSVGHNVVTLEQDGCLLVEHWTASSGGQTGTSFNYYDVRDKKWHQLYLDNSGNAGAFPAMAGNLIEGKMVLVTDEKQMPVSRWTWYVLGPGEVRQMAEQSSDGRKIWKIVWDSVYVKAPAGAPASK